MPLQLCPKPFSPQRLEFPNSDVKRDEIERVSYQYWSTWNHWISRLYRYVNGKVYHSNNELPISDFKLRILYINLRYAGSTHDSLIWRTSPIVSLLWTIQQSFPHTWLFGNKHKLKISGPNIILILWDSGFAVDSSLIVSYRSPTTSAEKLLNKAHS